MVPRISQAMEDYPDQMDHSFFMPLVAQGSRVESTELHHRAHQLATTLRKSMPESYPQEHSRRSQTLLFKDQDFPHELAQTAIYYLSNNLDISVSGWQVTLDLLEKFGLQNLKINIQSIRSSTIHGFMDTLFQKSTMCYLHWVRKEADTASYETFRILEWLLSSGYNPNRPISRLIHHHNYSTTPIQASVYECKLRLTECLLRAGADPNLLVPGGETRSSLEIACTANGMGDTREWGSLVSLLLRYGAQCASMHLNKGLNRAIRYQNMELATDLVKQGAELLAPVDAPYPWSSRVLQRRVTALCIAAARGKQETLAVLDLLRCQYPHVSVADFVAPDVLIEAAARGNDDLISLLCSINPYAICPNADGVTALQAAVVGGHLQSTQLLLGIQGPYKCDIGAPSLLHLAAYHNHKNIVQFLIEDGADFNAILETSSCLSLLDALDIITFTFSRSRSLCLTPLQVGIWGTQLNGISSSALLLIQAGAALTGCEVIKAIESLYVELLSAVLAAGGDANCTTLDGTSALQLALQVGAPRPTVSLAFDQECIEYARVAVITLLLEHGARLVGGKLFQQSATVLI